MITNLFIFFSKDKILEITLNSFFRYHLNALLSSFALITNINLKFFENILLEYSKILYPVLEHFKVFWDSLNSLKCLNLLKYFNMR